MVSTYRFFQNIVPRKNNGSVAPLPVHHHAIDVGQLGRVEPRRPELALLQHQQPQPVLEVGRLQLGRAEILEALSCRLAVTTRPAGLPLFLGTLGFRRLRLLVLPLHLKRGCLLLMIQSGELREN